MDQDQYREEDMGMEATEHKPDKLEQALFGLKDSTRTIKSQLKRIQSLLVICNEGFSMLEKDIKRVEFYYKELEEEIMGPDPLEA